MKHRLFTAAVTALMSLPLAAQQTDSQQQSPDAKIGHEFLKTLSDRRLKEIDRNPKKFLETSIRQLFQVAPDGVFDDTLAETARIHATARIRANYISSILEHDLDGDFKIETAEVARLSTILPPGGKTNLALLMLNADTDGDGALSTTEISKHAETRMAERPLPRSRNLMEFDVDKDGKVDVQELGRAIRIVENRHQTE